VSTPAFDLRLSILLAKGLTEKSATAYRMLKARPLPVSFDFARDQTKGRDGCHERTNDSVSRDGRAPDNDRDLRVKRARSDHDEGDGANRGKSDSVARGAERARASMSPSRKGLWRSGARPAAAAHRADSLRPEHECAAPLRTQLDPLLELRRRLSLP
jgi:hypothetical protein